MIINSGEKTNEGFYTLNILVVSGTKCVYTVFIDYKKAE